MTEEEIKALQEAADAKVRQAEEAARVAREEAEKAKADISKVVSELTEERRKKQEALEKANINNQGQPDVTSAVEQALQRQEQERRKQELAEALTEFKNSKTEFASDAAGLVFEKFSSELNKFNLSDVRTKSEAKARLEEIYKFVNFKGTQSSTPEYEGSPSSGYSVPETKEVTSKDTESAKRMANISDEKFSELQKKYPEAMGGLGI